MSRAAVIGDERRVGGYALAGATVIHAVSGADVEAAWSSLGDDVEVLVLTRESHAALERLLDEREGLVWAVIPA